jgi:hypothetical protein
MKNKLVCFISPPLIPKSKKPYSGGSDPDENGFWKKGGFSFSYAGMIQIRF